MMKKSLVLVIASLMILLLALPLSAQPKMRIAVMDFEVESDGAPRDLGKKVADMLVTSLVKTGQYKVYEREQLRKVMAEQNLGASGRVDQTAAARIGKLIGVDTLIYATVTEFGFRDKGLNVNDVVDGLPVKLRLGKRWFRCVIDARFIDAETGEILTAETVEGYKEKFKIGGGASGIYLGDSGWEKTEGGIATREAIDKIVKVLSSNKEKWGLAKCIHCGEFVKRNAKFCAHCGKPQKEIKLECPSCGEFVNKTDKFCGECGEKLNFE